MASENILPVRDVSINGVDEASPFAANEPGIAEEIAAERDEIRVGAGGPLTIPREEFDEADSDGEEIEGATSGKIRKPGRREFIILDPARMLPTKLLVHKPGGQDSADEEFYYVARELRAGIKAELKAVRVYLYWSVQARTHALWVVKVTPDNSWYDSLHEKLFRQPPAFFEQNEVRIASDKDLKGYRVRKRHRSVQAVPWPERRLEDLLGEAIGQSRFIRSADHPIYELLISGEEVG
jgi:hypothetical protein